MISQTCQARIEKRKSSDVLILPVWDTARGVKLAATYTACVELEKAISLGDVTGKKGEMHTFYLAGSKEKRLLTIGLGKQEECTADSIRLSYYQAASECLKRKWVSISVAVAQVNELRTVRSEVFVRALAEGIFLANYHFPTQKKPVFFKGIQWLGILPRTLEAINKVQVIVEGVHFARNLVNESAHTITPSYLANVAKQLAKKHPNLKAEILDLKHIERLKMGLLLAVAQGSAVEPSVIILSYKGQPKSKENTVLVGKGVTYDTGGLNLKPTGSMETMKADMAGAAAVLATVATAASLGLSCNVTAIIPATENAIGSRSYKPGDVFTSYNGTLVEIGNTDAEGRLILADAISYALDKLAPTRLIDIATLTGAVVVALGDEIAGLFANDQALGNQLMSAAQAAGEPLWQMPLYESYKEKLKSPIADLSNVGGRAGGAILGALFLDHFVDKHIPWAHIDCAGPAFLDKPVREWPKHAVGFGVKLLVEFLESITS